MLRFDVLIYVMLLTVLESSFNACASIKISSLQPFEAVNFKSLILSCLLFAYYIAFSIYLTVRAARNQIESDA